MRFKDSEDQPDRQEPGRHEEGLTSRPRARSCVACHTLGADQKPIGPHFADIAKLYKANEWVESILKPSEKIAQGYETQLILKDDGTVVSGFVISEKGCRISLRDGQGQTHLIDRDQIEERFRQVLSAMPEGLVGSLELE